MSLTAQNGKYIEPNTNGIATHQVGTGPVTQARNRNLPTAATTWANATNTVTWVSPGVTEVTITPQSSDCLVVYDAPNDATASAWLTDAGSQSSDVSYDYVFAGQTFTKTLSTGITRLDVLSLTGITRIVIGAN